MKRTNGMLIAMIFVVLAGTLAFIQAGRDPFSARAEDLEQSATGAEPPQQPLQAPSLTDLEKQASTAGEGPVQQQGRMANGEKFTGKPKPTEPTTHWYDGARSAKSGSELASGKTKKKK